MAKTPIERIELIDEAIMTLNDSLQYLGKDGKREAQKIEDTIDMLERRIVRIAEENNLKLMKPASKVKRDFY